MKKLAVVALVAMLLLALAAPALAAGHDGVPADRGRITAPGDRASEPDGDDEAEEPDADDELEEPDDPNESRPTEFPADPASRAWEHNRSIWSDRHPHESREATGKPEWAGETTPTANAQTVLARNAERLELKLKMPAEIREKLATLYADIIARMQERFSGEE